MSRSRNLSDDERALWAAFVRAIAPLPGTEQKTGALPARAGAKTAVPSKRPMRSDTAIAPQRPKPLAPLDRRFKQRVARGRQTIDARIDLHGMTQAEAHRALLGFLRRAQANGGRMVLVVTGKGRGQGEQGGAGSRGVLRQQVPQWLALPEFRPLIVGFDVAHALHGGEGALYVRLRRPR
jgi:DNA-nicking Smr family endonuclease